MSEHTEANRVSEDHYFKSNVCHRLRKKTDMQNNHGLISEGIFGCCSEA